MPSTSYGNQPPHNGPGYYPMGTSTHQPPGTSLQQPSYGMPSSSQHQQPMAGPTSSMGMVKQPDQFAVHGGMSAGMVSGGGMMPNSQTISAMTGPPLTSGQMMNTTGKSLSEHTSFLHTV